MFSWRAYIGNHLDLRAIGMDTESQAIEHWNKYGISEERAPNNEQYALSQSWKSYVNYYSDLPRAGINTKSTALKHWINFGSKEGRKLAAPCKILCVIAAHPNSQIKKESLERTVAEFKKFGDVVIVSSMDTYDISAGVPVISVPNNPIGVCYSKYQYYLNNYDISEYDRVILTNDSYYVLKGLDNFIRLCEVDAEMVAYLASNQIRYHYTDFLRCYNKIGIKKIKEHYNTTSPTSVSDAILKNEVGTSDMFLEPLVHHHTFPGYSENIYFDDIMLRRALFDDGLEVIKIKALVRKNYTEFPLDFDPYIYREFNSDLKHLSDEDATRHFKENGMSEGRHYKPCRDVINPSLVKIFDMLQIDVPAALNHRVGQ